MANLCSKHDQWDSLPPHAAITNGLIIFGLGVMCATEMGLQYRTVYNCFMICIFNSCDKNGKNLPQKIGFQRFEKKKIHQSMILIGVFLFNCHFRSCPLLNKYFKIVFLISI